MAQGLSAFRVLWVYSNILTSKCASRLFYLFAHLHLLYSDFLFSDLPSSSLLFSSLTSPTLTLPTSAFSSVPVGILTSKLPSMKMLRQRETLMG
jgi:hypothetical protein